MKLSALLISAFFLYFEDTTGHLYQPTKNTATLEKLICKAPPGSKVKNLKCKMKYIDRDHLTIDVSYNLTEPVYNMYLNIEPYFKFNRYTRIAGHIWENICDWLDGKRTSFIVDYYTPILVNNSNFNHPCPYSGFVFVKFDNISMKNFAFPQILPAGRYFEDIYITESYGSKSKVLLNYKLYNSVSDHRIEIV